LVRYRVFVRGPEIGFRDTWLWLPKSKVSERTIKNSLEYAYESGSKTKVLRMWKEEPNHILVPREFVDPSTLGYEVRDLTPEFPRVEIESSIELDKPWPDKTIQKDAFADIVDSGSGILNLACGRGKTIVFLHAAAQWGEPLLVVNDREHILLQWRKAIEKFLKFDGEIGWIQGKPHKWNWKHPITLAMLKSLANYADELPEGMTEWFGRIVWDEVHHLSAPTFSRTASLFPGKRYGASATVTRQDGTEVLYHGHVGPILHSNLEQDIIPSVLFRRSHTTVDLADPEVREQCLSCNGDVHFRKMAAYVGTRPEELDLCAAVVQRGLDAGRRILALSLSRAQTIAMHERFPDSGMIIAGNPKKPKDRLRIIDEKQLVFATTDLAREALDEERLDSLLLLNEFSDENLLQQAVGRIQRQLLEGCKETSKVVIIFHVRIPPMRAMGANLKKHFRRWNFETETIG
jgi:superfamily II DNA or RNA helicase